MTTEQDKKVKVKAPVVCTCSTGNPATCRRHRYLYSPWQGAYDSEAQGEEQ